MFDKAILSSERFGSDSESNEQRLKSGISTKLASIVLSNTSLFLIRVSLGSIFLWSGLAKMYRPYDFLSNVYDYELVGPATGLWIANALPWIEVVLGGALITGFLNLGSYCLSSFLLCFFTIIRAIVLVRGDKIPCGCAGAIDSPPISYSDIAYLLSLLTASCVGLMASVVSHTRTE